MIGHKVHFLLRHVNDVLTLRVTYGAGNDVLSYGIVGFHGSMTNVLAMEVRVFVEANG